MSCLARRGGFRFPHVRTTKVNGGLLPEVLQLCLSGEEGKGDALGVEGEELGVEEDDEAREEVLSVKGEGIGEMMSSFWYRLKM